MQHQVRQPYVVLRTPRTPPSRDAGADERLALGSVLAERMMTPHAGAPIPVRSLVLLKDALPAGVSHDVKNLLNAVFLHLQLAQRARAKGNLEQLDSALASIKDAVARGVDVLERLRHFSRQTPDTKAVPVDLSACAREAVLLAKPRLAQKGGRLCRVREKYGAPPIIAAEPSEIVSALLNLLTNASDALTEAGTGGIISVQTGEADWFPAQ